MKPRSMKILEHNSGSRRKVHGAVSCEWVELKIFPPPKMIITKRAGRSRGRKRQYRKIRRRKS